MNGLIYLIIKGKILFIANYYFEKLIVEYYDYQIWPG